MKRLHFATDNHMLNCFLSGSLRDRENDVVYHKPLNRIIPAVRLDLFETSWDWLMPVIRGFIRRYATRELEQFDALGQELLLRISNLYIGTPINEVYPWVVKAIHWHYAREEDYYMGKIAIEIIRSYLYSVDIVENVYDALVEALGHLSIRGATIPAHFEYRPGLQPADPHSIHYEAYLDMDNEQLLAVASYLMRVKSIHSKRFD